MRLVQWKGTLEHGHATGDQPGVGCGCCSQHCTTVTVLDQCKEPPQLPPITKPLPASPNIGQRTQADACMLLQGLQTSQGSTVAIVFLAMNRPRLTWVVLDSSTEQH
jgi:hypothetical protein